MPPVSTEVPRRSGYDYPDSKSDWNLWLAFTFFVLFALIIASLVLGVMNRAEISSGDISSGTQPATSTTLLGGTAATAATTATNTAKAQPLLGGSTLHPATFHSTNSASVQDDHIYGKLKGTFPTDQYYVLGQGPDVITTNKTKSGCDLRVRAVPTLESRWGGLDSEVTFSVLDNAWRDMDGSLTMLMFGSNATITALKYLKATGSFGLGDSMDIMTPAGLGSASQHTKNRAAGDCDLFRVEDAKTLTLVGCYDRRAASSKMFLFTSTSVEHLRGSGTSHSHDQEFVMVERPIDLAGTTLEHAGVLGMSDGQRYMSVESHGQSVLMLISGKHGVNQFSNLLAYNPGIDAVEGEFGVAAVDAVDPCVASVQVGSATPCADTDAPICTMVIGDPESTSVVSGNMIRVFVATRVAPTSGVKPYMFYNVYWDGESGDIVCNESSATIALSGDVSIQSHIMCMQFAKRRITKPQDPWALYVAYSGEAAGKYVTVVRYVYDKATSTFVHDALMFKEKLKGSSCGSIDLREVHNLTLSANAAYKDVQIMFLALGRSCIVGCDAGVKKATIRAVTGKVGDSRESTAHLTSVLTPSQFGLVTVRERAACYYSQQIRNKFHVAH